MTKAAVKKKSALPADGNYSGLIDGISELLDAARRASVRTVNALMTATYWEIGRRIVEFEQGGEERAGYGEDLVNRLAYDLSARFGKGFSRQNLQNMRQFYVASPPKKICQTLSGKLIQQNCQTTSGESAAVIHSTLPNIFQAPPGKSPQTLFNLTDLARAFPLSWSQYVRLLSVKDEAAREFYETEALRNGWSVRQLDRQIATRFYERTALSRNKAAMLQRGAKKQPGDSITPEQAIKDPYILEFLGLKDEYSENDLEAALIHRLEDFLMELGGDFAFVGRQKRLRIGDEWYRIDLLFFHRRLRCLVVIDLKVGKFTHADAGQMHLYLNYAREHWTHPDENPPVGLILCAEKNAAVAKYALEGLPNKVLASEYKLALPDEKLLAAEIKKARKQLETGGAAA
ncbi:MAG TPA: PDDEXK nuclease domain-containing protein [Verrucomicrobiae bacterium]|nr:PDDEXK nuclease domain-containing protein [Verrucomicrobiae bacterium]